MSSRFSSPGSVLSKSITVTGVTVGNATPGTHFPAGTPLENIHVQELIKPNNYRSPVLTLTGSGARDVEAGSSLTIALTSAIAMNDAGALTSLFYHKSGLQLQEVPSPGVFAVPAFTIGDEAIPFHASANYEAGVAKEGYAGDPIDAGSVNSASLQYRGVRCLFWDCNKPSGNSANIRAFVNKKLNPLSGTKFQIKVPAGSTSVKFAYPEALGAVASVKYLEGANVEIKDSFSSTIVAVEGANGFAAINYLVVVWTPAAPISQSITLDVTI